MLNSNFDVTVLTNLEVQQQQSNLLQNIGQSGELLLTVNYICALGKQLSPQDENGFTPIPFTHFYFEVQNATSKA